MIFSGYQLAVLQLRGEPALEHAWRLDDVVVDRDDDVVANSRLGSRQQPTNSDANVSNRSSTHRRRSLLFPR
jgi:hypothetical protein